MRELNIEPMPKPPDLPHRTGGVAALARSAEHAAGINHGDECPQNT
jgi:hypothetical protein